MRRGALLLLPVALAAVGIWFLRPRGREPGPLVPSEAPAPAADGAPPATSPATAPAPTPDGPEAVPGSRITGRVRDPSGNPVADARIVAIDAAARGGAARVRETTTDAEGRFALADVAGGSWSLSVESPAFVGTTVRDVAAGRRDVEIALLSRGWIEATVTGPDGSPWSGEVSVRARFGGFLAGGADTSAVPGGAERTVTSADAGGVVRVPGLPAGTWRVEAVVAGAAPLVSTGAGVETAVTDGTASRITLRLARAGRLEGALLDAGTETPVALASLDLRLVGPPATAGAARASARTDGAGRWSADGLAAGLWEIAGRAPNGAWIRERVEVPEGQVVRQDVRARPSGTVRVRLTHPDGTPAAGVTVVLATEDGTWTEPAGEGTDPRARRAPSWLSDAQGVHVRSSVPPGRVRVTSLPDADHRPAEPVVVEVPPGGTVEAEVVVSPARRPVR